MSQLKRVNRYTRAGKKGKRLHCPNKDCTMGNKQTIVYNFSWRLKTCFGCWYAWEKYEWFYYAEK